MATLKSVNVTKYDTPGGDNIIADGFIKTVEKVWIDTYVVAAAIPTTSQLCIARIPKNKKITDITVHVPVLGAAGTSCTLYCDTAATTAVVNYFGILQNQTPLAAQTYVFDYGTACTLKLNAVNTHIGEALPADVGIFLMFRPATTVTAGTITTIVKYT